MWTRSGPAGLSEAQVKRKSHGAWRIGTPVGQPHQTVRQGGSRDRCHGLPCREPGTFFTR
jgi:hypothetical protein